MGNAISAWGPAAAWAAVLFLLSELRSLPSLPLASSHDKLAHAVAYAVLGGCLAWGRRRSGNRAPHAALLAIGLGYGALDELHQSLVPNRVPSPADWLADAAGLALGYVLVLAVLSRTGPHDDPPDRAP